MRITRSTLAITLLLAAGAASADPASTSKSAELLTTALQTSMTEVELGKLAQKNAQSTGVNALGARLERDHARIGKMLAVVCREKGVAIPASVDASHRALIDSLGARTGTDFDAAYSAQMARDHEKAVELFSAAAASDDAELQELAKRALPSLREDQRLAGSFEKLNPQQALRVSAR